MTPGLGLTDLLAPQAVATFFDTHFQRRWLHLPGPPARGSALLTGERVAEAIRTGEDIGGQVRFHGAAPLGAELADYLDAGSPVVWDSPLGLSAAVDQTCTALAAAFGGLAWPNVYWTGPVGAPLPMHFDPHDVWIVQCEGVKRWRISSLRVGSPLDREEMHAANVAALAAGRAQAAERIDAELLTRPGDVLYVPRGLFHAASTPGGRSLHVTFAVQPPSGVDVVDALAELALTDAQFREYLPAPAADPKGNRRAAALDELRSRLADLLRSHAFKQAVDAHTRRMVERSSERE